MFFSLQANGYTTQLSSSSSYWCSITRVHVDPTIGKVDSPHSKKLRTYLEIVAYYKVDVTYENWKHVLAAQKDLIWEDIQHEFDIPEASDQRTKKKILQTPTRKVSTTLYAKSTTLARRSGPNFVKPAKTLRGRMCEKRHRPSRSKALPLMCCLLMDEKRKKKLEEVAQSESIEAVIDPPSPMTHTKKTCQMMFEAAKEIAKKIASQGSFVPHGRQDVLTATIGRPEHPGRSRAAGVGVRIKQYFGPAPRTSHTSSSMAPEDLEQLSQQIRDQLEESITENMQSHGLALSPKLKVGPSVARVSTKESCVDPSGNDPNTGSYGTEKSTDRPDHEVDDPIYLMTLSISQLFLKPLHMTETSMQVVNFDVYGFLEPQSIQRSGQSQFES
ncbi:hypothetical protein HKD37_06G017136 [Glycine soja]